MTRPFSLPTVVRLSKASFVLFLFLTVFVLVAHAQQTTPPQGTDQDCEKVNEEIKALQDLLFQLPVDRQHIANDLDQINKAIAALQQGVKFFSGRGFSKTARGEALEQLAKAIRERQHVEQLLEGVDGLIQANKDVIADLLKQSHHLASCAQAVLATNGSRDKPLG